MKIHKNQAFKIRIYNINSVVTEEFTGSGPQDFDRILRICKNIAMTLEKATIKVLKSRL